MRAPDGCQAAVNMEGHNVCVCYMSGSTCLLTRSRDVQKENEVCS